MQSLLYTGFLLQAVTIGRLTSIMIAVVGIISVIMGRQALGRTNRRIGSARPKAIAALLLGGSGMLASGLHLAISSGGFGTGSGRAGSIVALVISLFGAAFGWLALARSKQITQGPR